jgi:hypothetical protein
MAQTNANAAYAARTLSLAAKFMGTAPGFDVRPVDPLKNTKLNWKITHNGTGPKRQGRYPSPLKRAHLKNVPSHPNMVKNQ